MDNLSVGLSSYMEGGEGVSSQAELAELQKAMEAGHITGRETEGADLTGAQGSPLKVESLENTLKVITWKESDIQLWKKVPKLPAYNTVEEYNQLLSYGDDALGGFNLEGELPEVADSVYARKSQLVKFMGVTGAVTHPMQLVSTMIGDMLQTEINNKIQWLLKKADVALAFGDAATVPTQWNGYYQQHRDGYGGTLDSYMNSEVVVDLRGSILTEGAVEDAALGIIENHGYGDLLMAPPEILSNFVKSFHESKRIFPNTSALTDGVMGQRVNKFMSQFGEINLEYDKFLKGQRPRAISSAKLHNKAPDAIVPDATTPAAAVSATSKYSAADYTFAVAPVNRFGEGPLTAVGSAVAVSGTAQSVDLKFADGGGTYAATSYRVYQSEADGTTLYPVALITVAELAAGYDGAAAGLVRMKDRIMARTEQAFLIENSNQIWSFKQLAPLMKMDLAVLEPARRFMVLLYGTPQLYAPKKMVKFINVGYATP